MNSPYRIFYTLRYVKAEQLIYRAFYKLKSFLSVRKKWKKAVQRKARHYNPQLIINDFPSKWRKECFKEPKTFTFLNRTIPLKENWFPVGASPLWSFHLHYFDFVHQKDSDSEAITRLVGQWLDEVPLRHHWAWHPYPTSLRVCNWVWFYSANEDLFEGNFREQFLDSLYDQVYHIRGNLEFHLLGNHLLENIKALIVGGCFLDEESLVKRGRDLLPRELKEQILVDGGHFERTPSYHLIVLEDLLGIYEALKQTGRVLPPRLVRCLKEMSHFADTVFYREQFPALNDSSQEVSAPWAVLRAEIEEKVGLPEPEVRTTTHLKESGLIVYHDNDLSLFFDVGKIGPDYLPGHAHNDTLGVLLFFRGKPVLTDSGVYEYTEGKWRDAFRSAKAHNVIYLNDEEPNDIWKAHRVGYRGHPYDVTIDGLTFSANDSAYERLGVKWRRTVEIDPEGKELLIRDTLTNSRKQVPIEWNFHFAPGLSGSGGEKITISGEGLSLDFTAKGEGLGLEKTRSWYSPEFGLKEERLCVRGNTELPKGKSVYSFVITLK